MSARFNVPSGFEISVAPTSNLDQVTRDEIVDVCNRAFNETGFDELFNLVATAVNPMHVIGRVDGVLVSHAMWSTRQVWLADGTLLKTAYLDAVATDPAWQGRGLGSAVIRRVTEEIQDYDMGCLSTSRANFYARIGWELWNGSKAVKTTSGIKLTPDETVMIWRTRRTPTLDKNSQLTVKWRRSDPW